MWRIIQNSTPHPHPTTPESICASRINLNGHMQKMKLKTYMHVGMQHETSRMNEAWKIKHDSSMNHQVWIKHETSSINEGSKSSNMMHQECSINNDPSRLDGSIKSAASTMHHGTHHAKQPQAPVHHCHLSWMRLQDTESMSLDYLRWHVINGFTWHEMTCVCMMFDVCVWCLMCVYDVWWLYMTWDDMSLDECDMSSGFTCHEMTCHYWI